MNQEYSLRKNSLMYHYGIGGLWTNNSDETFVIKAPKYWDWENGQIGTITEENLRNYLGVNRIIFPPGAKDKQIVMTQGSITMGRFPGWHRCKGWREVESKEKRVPCGAMIKLEQTDGLPLCSNPLCTGHNSYKSTYAPIRFMVVCSEGHLDNFPFEQWVHNDESGVGHQLRYITTTNSGLAGIIIKCETCSSEMTNLQRNMSGALSPDSFEKREIRCSGRNPWLDDSQSICNCDVLTGVQKSSSNLLFPIVRNSIYCPSDDVLPSWIKEWLDYDSRGAQIKSLVSKLSMDTEPLKTAIKIFGVSFKEEQIQEMYSFSKEIEDYLNPTPKNDPFKNNGYSGIYQREFDRFLNFPAHQRTDDFTITRMRAEEYDLPLKDNIAFIGLMEKLRDTRVYAGFSRIEPQDDVTKESIRMCYGDDEVIGDIIRGEGIFINFLEDPLKQWMSRSQAQDRFEELTSIKRKELMNHHLIQTKEDALKYMFIHSLSHALIGEIAIFSGYNTASIKERIYVGSNGKKEQMSGLLIYTSDGDSEGSLGGLVRLGKPGVLEKLMAQAIKRATWCSSDPLCSSSIPKGNNGSNLAACHHCLLLPETCCEARNEYLDREMIISINDNQLGFFKN